VKESYDHTKLIIEKLKEAALEGVQGYADSIDFWLTVEADIDSEEKKQILSSMFTDSHVSLIYGAAGTGKTYILKAILNENID
jgi:DNA replication protein DnaC